MAILVQTLSIVILPFFNINFVVYPIFYYYIQMVDLITLVVNSMVDNLFLGVIAALVTKEVYGVIVLIEKSVDLFPSSTSPPI